MPGRESGTHSFTFFVDGPGQGRALIELTRAVHAQLGVRCTADPAGLWVRIETGAQAITEDLADRVARLAMGRGLYLHDRVGSSFVASISADQLRSRLQHEWMSRWATALVFLAPAIALHYLKPMIATGSTLIGSLIEAGLVGWSMVAACFPVLVQGAFSARFVPRVSPDLLGSLAILVPFVLGLWGTLAGHPAPPFHASAFAIVLVSGQRALLWKRIGRLDGAGHALLPTDRVFAFFVLLGVVTLVFDRSGGLAVLLVCPALLSHLAVNRIMPGAGLVMALVLFGVVLAIAPLAVRDGSVLSGRIESAFLFQAGLVVLLGITLGTRRHT